MACFKEEGKVPSENERLTIFVMGWRRTSRQDLSRKVGMMSREQDELDDSVIADRTSSQVAGTKADKEWEGGRGNGMGSGRGDKAGGKAAVNLAILPLKKSRNEAASSDGALEMGRMLGADRHNRDSRLDQSFLGWPAQQEMSDLK